MNKPRLDQGPDYERGFVDGMQHQMQSSVDKAVNRMAQQEPVAWKLVPAKPTEEMLKAMDECSKEGYDERLYAGHAASVYMAAWDACPDMSSQPKPVSHAIIAGALFDFMGWLTSRKERLVLSSADDASPAVEAITEFAKMRDLSLDDAKVRDWSTSPPAQRTWVGLTDEEWLSLGCKSVEEVRISLAIQAKLKEKNT